MPPGPPRALGALFRPFRKQTKNPNFRPAGQPASQPASQACGRAAGGWVAGGGWSCQLHPHWCPPPPTQDCYPALRGTTRRPPARRPPTGLAGWLAGRPAGRNFDFFFDFSEMSQKCPPGHQGPWGPIFRYFHICLTNFWVPLGPPLGDPGGGPGAPLFALKGCCAVYEPSRGTCFM